MHSIYFYFHSVLVLNFISCTVQIHSQYSCTETFTVQLYKNISTAVHTHSKPISVNSRPKVNFPAQKIVIKQPVAVRTTLTHTLIRSQITHDCLPFLETSQMRFHAFLTSGLPFCSNTTEAYALFLNSSSSSNRFFEVYRKREKDK